MDQAMAKAARRRPWVWVSASTLLLGTAYGVGWFLLRGTGCGLSDYATVVVQATDARTGAALSSDLQQRGIIIIRDGKYVDTGQLLSGAGHNDRAATYHVTVRVPGYREWTAPRARVRYQEPCRLKPVVLTARLQPTH